jgi:uncharacterized membrane protein YgcG
MNFQDDEMNRDFNEMLEPLRQVPQRNTQKAAATRSAFLARVETFSGEIPATIPVSETPLQRLNGWISGIINPFRRKERVQMFNILTALVVAVTLVFGGAGVTVFAAQDSLPDQALYPVKIFSEDMRVNFAADPESQVKLLLNFADRRVEEMAALLSERQPVSQQVQDRYQQQMASALRTAAGLNVDNMVKSMAMIQLRANNQLRIMNQVQPDRPGQGVLTQQRVQAVIREQLQLLELGLQDPQQFQNQYQNQFQHQFQYQQGVTTTITGTLPVSGTFGAQHQFQYQQGVSGTITGTLPITGTPGLQYGPGPDSGPGPNAGPDASPGPEYGPGPDYGPGPGDGSGSASNPEPGSDRGNGAGTGEPSHSQDSFNAGNNDNGGATDPGGGSDSGGNSDPGGGSDSGGNSDTGGSSDSGAGNGGGKP